MVVCGLWSSVYEVVVYMHIHLNTVHDSTHAHMRACDERTMGVSSIEGIGRFNVVGKVNVGVTNAVLAAAGGAV